ncbi:MAG: glycosyltransferase [Scytolyngbya sp. HA4215-MV1]|jgi:glycosyltransferase involved in cell wall biosynthesis|nr:glycosyltransferase [Scytolyngbya sp. HA4215-MV1]
MGQTFKVLISAYACRPGEGSEPGIGWEVARELAQHHQVWVLTRENNRPAIQAELEKLSALSLQVVFHDVFGSHLWRQAPGGVYLHYYLWQIGAYFVARKLHQQIQFDLAHHVTYVRYAAPSFLSLLPIPFIWGPVGGGESAPPAFWQDFNLHAKMYESLRSLARRLGEWDPFVRMTARRSVLSWATTSDTAKRLQALGTSNVQVLSQLGLSNIEIRQLAQSRDRPNQTIRFISIGRLLHWKGFHLGLRAFAQAELLPPESEYWILGDGPERNALEKLAHSLGVMHRVKFCNKLPRSEVLIFLQDGLALVHPSLHESGGMVCLEAMAAGLPVICLDLGGPALLVTPETGIKVPAHSPEQAVTDMAKSMTHLANNPTIARQLGQAGQQRTQELFSWTVKGTLLTDQYEALLQRNPDCKSKIQPA